MRATVAGRTLEMHKLARALQRENPECFAGDDGLAVAYARLDDSMREKTGASGQENRRKAAVHWEALQNRREAAEYVPAFDPVRSGHSIADLIEDGDEAPVMNGLLGEAGASTGDSPAHATPSSAPMAGDNLDLDAVARNLGLDVHRDGAK